ncbi:MAG: hypothetical protein KAH68_03450, partial [Draconibacterium sp.]|nr:hypothetical protein [Draconibacterium sp.]
MNNYRFNSIILLLFVGIFLWSCSPKETKWKGQTTLKKVSTLTKPIQYQLKKTYNLGNGIYCSNEFDGARLNGVVLTNDTVITALITPENTPINGSPWYAFKIWSETEKNIQLKITYSQGVNHRYYPKLSSDGINWNNLDSINFLPDTASISKGNPPVKCGLKLTISPDTLWVSAQELITSKHINKWAENLAKKPFISFSEIGKSYEGRAINLLKIGNSQKMIMVLA